MEIEREDLFKFDFIIWIHQICVINFTVFVFGNKQKKIIFKLTCFLNSINGKIAHFPFSKYSVEADRPIYFFPT